jgi:hypothetical protein
MLVRKLEIRTQAASGIGLGDVWEKLSKFFGVVSESVMADQAFAFPKSKLKNIILLIIVYLFTGITE